MCKWIKSLFSKPPLEPLYPNEDINVLLPRAKVIEELEYDILIHEAYAAWVVQDPGRYPPSVYGDYNWHIRWIQVYKSAIYYMNGG